MISWKPSKRTLLTPPWPCPLHSKSYGSQRLQSVRRSLNSRRASPQFHEVRRSAPFRAVACGRTSGQSLGVPPTKPNSCVHTERTPNVCQLRGLLQKDWTWKEAKKVPRYSMSWVIETFLRDLLETSFDILAPRAPGGQPKMEFLE